LFEGNTEKLQKIVGTLNETNLTNDLKFTEGKTYSWLIIADNKVNFVISSTATFNFTTTTTTTTTLPTYNISGVVKDDKDNNLNGATIKIEELNKQTTSNSDGQFSFTDILTGTYNIVVSLNG
jgi:hypothetical protein